MIKLENYTSQYCGVLLTSLRLAWEPQGELPDRKLRRRSVKHFYCPAEWKMEFNLNSFISALQIAFHFIRRVCCCCLLYFRINVLQLPA